MGIVFLFSVGTKILNTNETVNTFSKKYDWGLF